MNEMETANQKLHGKGAENSLTESWNVIEAQEVHNVSEGSDGESIEVIDEDAQNGDSSPSSIKESESNMESCDISRSDEEETALHEPDELSHDNLDGPYLRACTRLSDSEVSRGINLLNACGFIALFFALLFSGATFSIFLMKVEEFALGTFSYFSPSKTPDKEYQELLNQIKTYKEESKDLKGLIADLNSAVLTLRNELESQRDSKKSDLNEEINLPEAAIKRETLFKQILDIHTGNVSPNGNKSDRDKGMPHEDSFKIIKETLFCLRNGEKDQYEEVETLRLFSQIPEHLSVLNNFDSSNQNLNKFIDTWRAKLSRINEKLIADIRQMQLKVTSHIIKSLRSTQKSFFEKLCELKDMKKPECYDTFLKPYEYSDTAIPNKNENSFDNNKENINPPDSKKTKTGFVENCPSTPKKNQDKKKQHKESESTTHLRGRPNDNENMSQNVNMPTETLNSGNINERNIESNFVPGDSHDSKTLLRKQKMGNNKKYKSQLNPEMNNEESIKVDKGMVNSDLLNDPNEASANSYSSFSMATHREGGRKREEGKKIALYEKYLRPRGGAFSWFLRMGIHRSRTRKREARSDWLFERARYRRRRNLPYFHP